MAGAAAAVAAPLEMTEHCHLTCSGHNFQLVATTFYNASSAEQ